MHACTTGANLTQIYNFVVSRNMYKCTAGATALYSYCGSSSLSIVTASPQARRTHKPPGIQKGACIEPHFSRCSIMALPSLSPAWPELALCADSFPLRRFCNHWDARREWGTGVVPKWSRKCGGIPRDHEKVLLFLTAGPHTKVYIVSPDWNIRVN